MRSVLPLGGIIRDLGRSRDMAENTGIGQRWEAYRPSKTLWFWSCVACVIATIVIGFAWGGWVTGGSAAQMASDAADSARAQLAADYCVSRFRSAANASAQFASLKKTDEWDRSAFIKKGGWATLPGMTQPVSGAADQCVKQLMTAKAPVTKAAASG